MNEPWAEERHVIVAELPPLLRQTRLLNRCPVCGVFFGTLTSAAGGQSHATYVAISAEFCTDRGEPIYLRTCGEHGLADVWRRFRATGGLDA